MKFRDCSMQCNIIESIDTISRIELLTNELEKNHELNTCKEKVQIGFIQIGKYEKSAQA